MEAYTFDQVFMELALDQSGISWPRSVKYMKNADPIASYMPMKNSIFRFEWDSLDLVYTDLPNLGTIAFDRKDQLWAMADRFLVLVNIGTGPPANFSPILEDANFRELN